MNSRTFEKSNARLVADSRTYSVAVQVTNRAQIYIETYISHIHFRIFQLLLKQANKKRFARLLVCI